MLRLMTILAILIPMSAYSAPYGDEEYFEEDDTKEVWFSPQEDKLPLVGYIVHKNLDQLGVTIEEETLSTTIGDITYQIERTWNSDCPGGCPDTISIIGLPEGYVAIPASYETPERTTFRVKIFEYQGM